MITREELRHLVDELPESELDTARRFLEYLRITADPVVRAFLDAPEDDEPTTSEEDESARKAWQEYLRGEAISAEDAQRKLLS